MVASGDVLAGRYRLVEAIGEGGMGVVWKAHDEHDGIDVAVKVLHKTLIGDASSVARFENEARLAGSLDHPNVCSVVDVARHDGVPVLVMELLEGETLGQRLTRERRIDPPAAVAILIDVLSALEAAHEAGVLHRDLKPENVFLSHETDGSIRPRILDFGVAKFIGDEEARVKMTRSGALVGTPAYMSPEQALGQDDIDVRSDVWAIGVILYEMLVGTLPYVAANYNAMLVRIATGTPRDIGTACPSLDDKLARVVRRALAVDRRHRIATAKAMREALIAVRDGRPLGEAFEGRLPQATPAIGSTPMSWAEEEARPRVVTLQDGIPNSVRRPWLPPLLIAGALGLAGVLLFRAGHAAHVAGRMRPVGVAGWHFVRAVEPPPPVVRIVTVPATPDPPSTSCTLSIDGLPVGASVSVNGEPASTPAQLHRGVRAIVRVAAVGFAPWSATVTPAGDVALTYDARRVRAGRDGRRPLQGGVASHPDF